MPTRLAPSVIMPRLRHLRPLLRIAIVSSSDD
jgi:hypothetical protein